MSYDERHGPDIHAALASFRWIRDSLQTRRRLFNRFQAVSATSRPPSVYATRISDEAILLGGGTPEPASGLPLTLSGYGFPRVTVGETVLEEDDFRFAYSDDVLSLTLQIDANRCEGLSSMYVFGHIAFSPSGETFSGMVNQIWPAQRVTYKWEGHIVCPA